MENKRLEEYLDYLQLIRSVSRRTLEAYSSDLKSFANYCENHGLLPETANSIEVKNFIADLSAEGIASVSVNRALSSIRGLH